MSLFGIKEKQLLAAIHEGELEKCQKLIGRGADVNAKDKEGNAALLKALEVKALDIAYLLIDHGANVEVKFMTGSYKGCTALEWADLKDETALVRKLKQAGAFDQQDFIDAAGNGKMDEVKAMLKKGADVNAKKGISALIAAAAKGQMEMVKFLLEHGADINAKSDIERTNDGSSAFINAVENGHMEIIQFLIDKGADIDARGPVGWSALMIAIRKDRSEVIKLLLNNPATDVNAVDHEGETALMHAVYHGRRETVEQLLARGADIQVKDRNGQTALAKAIDGKHKEIENLLLSKGAIPKAPEPWRLTGELIAACRSGRLEEIKKAVASGLSINAEGEEGSLLCYAAAAQQLETVKWLVENGAAVNLELQSPIDWNERDTLLCWLQRKISKSSEVYKYLESKGAVAGTRTTTY